mmetsp:Transcript_40454/g.56200  ORF Transcript_40454/g.56200 Transcript_40454/m.56200 type:complete len:86 (-) Transcript_40454:369-626(-)
MLFAVLIVLIVVVPRDIQEYNLKEKKRDQEGGASSVNLPPGFHTPYSLPSPLPQSFLSKTVSRNSNDVAEVEAELSHLPWPLRSD